MDVLNFTFSHHLDFNYFTFKSSSIDGHHKSMIEVYYEGLHSMGKRDQTISTSGFSLLKSHSGLYWSQEYCPTTDGEFICSTLKMTYFSCKRSKIPEKT